MGNVLPRCLACLVVTASMFGASAQTPTLITDVNTTATPNLPSEPKELVSLPNGSLLFTALTADLGRELWVSIAGQQPVLVKDIQPGVYGSEPHALTAAGAHAYFGAAGGLWRSDGTVSGTRRIKPGIGRISSMCAAGSRVFFVVNFSNLWTSDGTAAGTKRVGLQTSAAWRSLHAVGNTLYFVGSSFANGGELWKSDGTTAGTKMVKDIWPGGKSSQPASFATLGNRLFFTARTAANGLAYWVSDGTANGTVLLKDTDGTKPPIAVSHPPGYFAAFGNRFYFGATHGNGKFGLWVTDGTTAGTTKVKDTSHQPLHLTVVGNRLHFLNFVNFSTLELWTSNGSAAGTVVTKSMPTRGWTETIALGNQLLFLGNDTQADMEPWVSDGTTTGTKRLKDVYPGKATSFVREFARNLLGRVLFTAVDGKHGRELWITDGTTAGTKLFADIKPFSKTLGIGDAITPSDHEGLLVFDAMNTTWVTNGTAAGTKRITAGAPGLVRKRYEPPRVSHRGAIYFSGHRFYNAGLELVRSDGTLAGTRNVSNINPTGTAQPDYLTPMGAHVYFTAKDTTHGMELWRTGGTLASTQLVKDLLPGSIGSQPRDLVVMGSRLYLVANDKNGMGLLYRSDGTATGTTVIDASKSPQRWYNPERLITMGGALYFEAFSPTTGTELWKSDGTAAGTVLVKDIDLSAARSVWGVEFTVMNGVLYFPGFTQANGWALWRSDGTAAGTRMVKDIHPGKTSRIPSLDAFGVYAGTLYFAADDGKHGRELWASDGTATGTRLLKDVLPGAEGGLSNGITPPTRWRVGAGKWLYFAADDGQSGTELWRTDGTPAGTKLFADVYKGPHGSAPRDLVLSGGKLFFSADDGVHGREMWVVDPGAHAAPIGVGCSNGQPPELSATSPVLGATLDVKVTGARTRQGMLVWGTVSARPTHIGAGCVLYVDLTRPYLSVPFAPNASGAWSMRATIPNQSSLAGLLLPLQAAAGPTAQGPLAADLTNGLFLAVGR